MKDIIDQDSEEVPRSIWVHEQCGSCVGGGIRSSIDETRGESTRVQVYSLAIYA